MVTPWWHHGDTMATPWCHHGDTMVTPWSHPGDTMVTPWGHHGVTMGSPDFFSGHFSDMFGVTLGSVWGHFFDIFRTFSDLFQECSQEVQGPSKGVPATFQGCFRRLFSYFFGNVPRRLPVFFQVFSDLFNHFVLFRGRGGSLRHREISGPLTVSVRGPPPLITHS